MALAGNPKKLAQDIAEGFFIITPPMLKSYTPADLKVIVTNIAIVSRELRQEIISSDDVQAIKARNMKLSRLNQADMVIQAFCKKRRLQM